MTAIYLVRRAFISGGAAGSCTFAR